MKRILLAVLVLGSMSGCKPVQELTKSQEVERDTVRIIQREREEIRDSIFISTERAGDTVYITRERMRDRERVRVDTLWREHLIMQTDTIIKEVQAASAGKAGRRGFWYFWQGVICGVILSIIARLLVRVYLKR